MNGVLSVSASYAGCWALTNDGRVFFRHGTYATSGSVGTSFITVYNGSV